MMTRIKTETPVRGSAFFIIQRLKLTKNATCKLLFLPLVFLTYKNGECVLFDQRVAILGQQSNTHHKD